VCRTKAAGSKRHFISDHSFHGWHGSLAIFALQPVGWWSQHASGLWMSPALCLLCLEHWTCSLQPGVREAGLTVGSRAVCSEKACSVGTHLHVITCISVPRTEGLQGQLILFYLALFHANNICIYLQCCPWSPVYPELSSIIAHSLLAQYICFHTNQDEGEDQTFVLQSDW